MSMGGWFFLVCFAGEIVFADTRNPGSWNSAEAERWSRKKAQAFQTHIHEGLNRLGDGYRIYLMENFPETLTGIALQTALTQQAPNQVKEKWKAYALWKIIERLSITERKGAIEPEFQVMEQEDCSQLSAESYPRGSGFLCVNEKEIFIRLRVVDYEKKPAWLVLPGKISSLEEGVFSQLEWASRVYTAITVSVPATMADLEWVIGEENMEQKLLPREKLLLVAHEFFKRIQPIKPKFLPFEKPFD